MTTAERREKEEQWATEMLRSIRDAFAYGGVRWGKELYIAMNRDTYETLNRLWSSTLEESIFFSPSIYGLPVKVDPDVAAGRVCIKKSETVHEYIPSAKLMGEDLFGEEYGED